MPIKERKISIRKFWCEEMKQPVRSEVFFCGGCGEEGEWAGGRLPGCGALLRRPSSA